MIPDRCRRSLRAKRSLRSSWHGRDGRGGLLSSWVGYLLERLKATSVPVERPSERKRKVIGPDFVAAGQSS